MGTREGKALHARVFWSGGSQAVRLPKALRLSASEVKIRRDGNALVLEPVNEGDDWSGFWERLAPLSAPVRRWPTRENDPREDL